MTTPTRLGERDAYIRGIGQSQVGRKLGRGDLDLTCEAAVRAVADAGLTMADIDGLACYPGGGLGSTPGFNGPGAPDVQDALRLKLNWLNGTSEGGAQMSTIVNAIMAVSLGLAKNVLVYRTVTESSAVLGRRGAALSTPTVGGQLQWMLAPGAISAPHWFATLTNRYMTQNGLKREQLGQIAVNARRNAALNPNGIFKDPMTIEDYLAVRMISTPLCLFDCDTPCDGATAFVISHVDSAGDAPKTPIHVNALGTALRGRDSWDQYESPHRTAVHYAAKHLWERSDLTAADVDVAELYDGFTIITLTWLEALGFCADGEAGDFVEGGTRIALDGELPLNTNGGQLSGGRLHGLGFVHEAVVQLRGEGGDRQVQGRHEVAVVGNGGGTHGGAMLLTAGIR
jgi:acetyl-CoA acetyltransferase